MRNPKTVIIYGKTVSGKGTQLLRIKKYFDRITGLDTLTVEIGTKLREITSGATETSKLTNEVLNSGGNIEAFMVIYTWGAQLVEKLRGNLNLVIEGGRHALNAEILDGALRLFYKRPCPVYVIILDVSDECCFIRSEGRGRPDDTPENVRTKLEWWYKDVSSSLDAFERRNCYYKVITINGEQKEEKVYQDIIKAIENS